MQNKKKVYLIISIVSFSIVLAALAAIGGLLLAYKRQSDNYEQLAAAARTAAPAAPTTPATEAAEETQPVETEPPLPTVEIPINFDYLKVEDEDIIGWIVVDGTLIDYPILYDTTYNYYYLNRNYEGTATGYGSIFVLVENAGDFTNADGFFAQALVQLDINDGNWAGMAQANSWSHIYCLENCMFLDAQLNAYSTGVMFKANMDIAPDRVFNENGDVVSNQSNWPTNMFYFNYNFYTSVDAIRKLVLNNLPDDVTDNSTTEELARYSIKRFKKTENYSCYYNYWIKHLDNNSPEMGVMEFGIVRNNIYRLSVNKIAGLGSGEPFIDPDQPDEYKAELDINFNVFPWAVRNQDVELE